MANNREDEDEEKKKTTPAWVWIVLVVVVVVVAVVAVVVVNSGNTNSDDRPSSRKVSVTSDNADILIRNMNQSNDIELQRQARQMYNTLEKNRKEGGRLQRVVNQLTDPEYKPRKQKLKLGRRYANN